MYKETKKMKGQWWAALIAAGLIAAPAFAADSTKASKEKTVSAAQNAQLSAAVLAEIRKRVAARLSSAQVETLLNNLASMNYTQVAALTGGPASQLERLIPGAGSVAAQAGQSPLDTAQQGGSDGNSAAQQAVQGQKDMRGGFETGSGFASDDDDAPVSGFVMGGTSTKKDPKESETGYPIANPHTGLTVDKRKDGSFSISNGTKKEYYDSNYKRATDPRDKKGEPVPDENAGSSGIVSAEEWRTIFGMLGSKGAPPKEASNPGSGGMAAPTTTTAGTPTDADAARAVDLVQVQEFIRISVEKLGPKLN